MIIFSQNEEKAAAEKFYLLYSAVWPLLFFSWCKVGYFRQLGDFGNTFVSILIGSPFILYPLQTTNTKVLESYWFKFSVWIGIYSFVASYFFSEYFFDVLGMVYKMPNLSVNFDSVLVGYHEPRQVVPLMMYVHCWYFFMTYHSASIVFIRVITSVFGENMWPVALVFTAWLFSAGEIYFTTLKAIEDVFTYRDIEYALTIGSTVYSCYFVSSFYFLYWMDEHKVKRWSLEKTVESALASSMLSFILLDLVSQFVVTGWQTRV